MHTLVGELLPRYEFSVMQPIQSANSSMGGRQTKTRRRATRNMVCAFIVAVVVCASASAQTSWKFIAVGDSQGFDNGVNTTILSELASEFIRQDVDCVLFCGDQVWRMGATDEQFESELRNWRATMQPVYDANIAVYPCRGNHENWGSAAVWQNVFDDLPANGPAGEKHMTYSVTYKNAMFVAIDEFVTPYRINQTWLDSQLAANSQPLVFVFGHMPAFRAYHYDCLDDYPDNRDAFWDSISRAGGRTYFCGHDHFFDHAHVDDGDGDPDNDVHQYISGTGGAPFYPFYPPYSGLNSHYTLEQLLHIQAFGYILAEVNDLDVNLTWMKRDTVDVLTEGTYEPNETWGFSVSPLILLSPNDGQSIRPGSSYEIRWRTYETATIEKVRLEYSVDNGVQWNHIDTVSNTGSYNWAVPAFYSNQCVVRISDVNDPAVSDVSFKAFQTPRPSDFNSDGQVDGGDFAALAGSWKSTLGQSDYDSLYDISDPSDGVIDSRDLAAFVQQWLMYNSR